MDQTVSKGSSVWDRISKKNTTGKMGDFNLTSSAFEEGREIPSQHAGTGKDRSPEIHWTDVPEGTETLALICDDPDAPGSKPFVHWVAYNIPPQMGRLPEGVPSRELVKEPVYLEQGTNSFGETGYRGPLPPVGHGWHRYFFKLYALDRRLVLGSGASREDLLRQMEGHVLGEARLMGKFRREAASHAA